MKKIIFTLILVSLALCLFSCGEKFDENYVYDGTSIVGTWQEEEIDYAGYYTYSFSKDGKMELKQFVYGIEVSADVGTYTVDGNTLEVTFPEENGADSLVKNRFSITEDGELVMVRLSTVNEIEEVETVYVPFEPVFNLENNLIGTWENTEVENELWIFDENYEITLPNEEKSEKMLYSVDEDKVYMLFLIDSGENKIILETPIIFEYELDGDTLKLFGEVDYVFKKK